MILSQAGNKIICDLSTIKQQVGEVDLRLIKDNVTISRSKAKSLKHSFVINVSGTYRVQLSYIKSDMKRKSISECIDVVICDIKIDILSKVIITKRYNFITCDLRQIENMPIKLKMIALIKDGVTIKKSKPSKYFLQKFEVYDEGNYFVRITYTDVRGRIKTLSTSMFAFTQQEVFNSLKKNIKLTQTDNTLRCDVTEFSGRVCKILSYNLIKDGKIIRRFKSNSFKQIFFISESGQYSIHLYFIALDNRRQRLRTPTIFCDAYDIARDIRSNLDATSTFESMRLFFNIIFAFVIREFQQKYERGYLGYFAIIVGPFVQISLLVGIFSLFGRKTMLGLSLPLFILTGFLPYHLFIVSGRFLTLVSSNRSLLSYRQVKIIDILLAKYIVEFLIFVVIFTGGLFVCSYVGTPFHLYNPLSLFLAIIMLLTLSLAVSLILAIIGFYFYEFNYAIQVIFRALFYISGIFFSIENVPVQYQKYFLWNPLFQLIEYIRFSFVKFSLPTELSYIYLIKCTVYSLILGVSLYFVHRNRFTTNDKARI